MEAIESALSGQRYFDRHRRALRDGLGGNLDIARRGAPGANVRDRVFKVRMKVVIDNLAVQDDYLHILNHPDVLQRVAVDRDDVGDFSGLHRAEIFVLTERLGNVDRRRLNRLHGREPRLDKHNHLLMDAKCRQSIVRIRTGSYDPTRLNEPHDEICELLIALAGLIQPLG